MQTINVKLIKQRIVSSNIFISDNISKKFELGMECRAKMKTAKDEDDRTILLNVELNINAKEEELKIVLISDVVFELEQLPEDFNEIAEKKLVPMATENLLNSLDEMLVIMGHSKMELAKKI